MGGVYPAHFLLGVLASVRPLRAGAGLGARLFGVPV